MYPRPMEPRSMEPRTPRPGLRAERAMTLSRGDSRRGTDEASAPPREHMTKKKIATVWLDGCSGCHMSFLDIDERLVDLADKIDIVYSPLVDIKEFPPEVDVALVEGAVSSEDDLERIHNIRKHAKILVALGDCAVTGN